MALLFSEHASSQTCISSANLEALAKTENAPFKSMLDEAARQKLGRDPSDSELPIMLLAGK